MDHCPFDKPGRSAIMPRNVDSIMNESRGINVVVTSALLPVVVGEELQPVG
jgi:hypothetical protein